MGSALSIGRQGREKEKVMERNCYRVITRHDGHWTVWVVTEVDVETGENTDICEAYCESDARKWLNA